MFIETIKNIASVIGCVISVITLIGLIVKPLRNKIAAMIKKASHADDAEKAITLLNNSLEDLKKTLNEVVSKSEETDTVLLQSVEDLKGRVDQLSTRVFENERDRIRMELSDCAARCRRGIQLCPEEYDNIKESYRKYDEVLHCNGIGHDTWVYINNYYNSQNFKKVN